MIFTLFLLLPTQILCVVVETIDVEDLGSILKHTLGYNFNGPLEIGMVLIWKISENYEPFTTLQYSGKDIQFGSEETYLLFTQKYLQEVTAYYWLGTYSSLIDKQVAAKYAVLLTEFLKTVPNYMSDRIFIAREVEGIESDSFQHTMKMFNGHAGPREQSNLFTQYLDATFPSPRPNLYVIRGYRPKVKKIPLSLGLRWLINNDMCLLLETEYKVDDMMPIHYVCGAETKEEHIENTKELINQFYIYFADKLKEVFHAVENNRNSYDFKKFLEVLEDCRFYNPYEIDDSDDHLKNAEEFEISRAQSVSLYQVNSYYSKLEKLYSDRLFHFEDDSMGVLLDEKSVTGALLMFGDIEDTVSRVKGIQLAEEYLDKTYPSSSGKVMKMRVIGHNTNPFLT